MVNNLFLSKFLYELSVTGHLSYLQKGVYRLKDITYFVYCNGISEKDEFNNILEFKTKLIPYKGNDSWVEPTLIDLKETLMKDEAPEGDPKCSYCSYVKKTLMV